MSRVALRKGRRQEVSLLVARCAGRYCALRLPRIHHMMVRIAARCADSCGASCIFICSSRAWRRVFGAVFMREIYIRKSHFQIQGWLVEEL
ncbi:hypothetical protein A2U01_0063713, partial [Trifolium medium]|nr:hypothetical protein [Trifolium medium]